MRETEVYPGYPSKNSLEYREERMNTARRTDFRKVHSTCTKIVFPRTGSRIVVFKTEGGNNKTGVFRSLLSIIRQDIAAAGGSQAIIRPQPNFRGEDRIFSSPASEAPIEYQRYLQRSGEVAGFDLFADGTTLSSLGSQSVCHLRVRMVNIKGRSEKWHEMGIAPIVQPNQNMSASAQSQLRSKLFQRFLLASLREIIESSKNCISEGDNLIFPQLCTLVGD